MGKKYIIELENKPFSNCDNSSEVWRVKGFNALFFDQNGINKLTPYNNDCDINKEPINIGDVLVMDGIACIVLDVDGNIITVFTENGRVEYRFTKNYKITKTGVVCDIGFMIDEMRKISRNNERS